MTNGKNNYRQNNSKYVEKNTPNDHLLVSIMTANKKERTIVYAVMQNFFHPTQNLILEVVGQVSLSH